MGTKIKQITGFLAAAACTFLMSAPAIASSANAGGSSAQFLKLNGSARSSSMGDTYAGMPSEASSVFCNPAGLAAADETMLSMVHNFMFEDISCDWVSFVHSTKYGTFGAGVQYLSYGTIKEINEIGVEGGSLSPYDMAVTISHGREIFNVLLGINLKYVKSEISENASAVCVDLGGMYKIMDDDISIGTVIQNLGTGMKYLEKSERLPLNFKLGGQYSAAFNWILALDLNMPNDGPAYAGAGAEYLCEAGMGVNILGRLGYTTRTSGIDGLTGITAGFGVAYKSYRIDYAFIPLGDVGLTHKIGISIKFD